MLAQGTAAIGGGTQALRLQSRHHLVDEKIEVGRQHGRPEVDAVAADVAAAESESPR